MKIVMLAASTPRNLDPDIVRPGWLALGLVALIGVVLFLLVRSFIKHSRKAAEHWSGDDD